MSNTKTGEPNQITIDFSQLSEDEQNQYYNFLFDHTAKFEQTRNDYQAVIQLKPGVGSNGSGTNGSGTGPSVVNNTNNLPNGPPNGNQNDRSRSPISTNKNIVYEAQGSSKSPLANGSREFKGSEKPIKNTSAAYVPAKKRRESIHSNKIQNIQETNFTQKSDYDILKDDIVGAKSSAGQLLDRTNEKLSTEEYNDYSQQRNPRSNSNLETSPEFFDDKPARHAAADRQLKEKLGNYKVTQVTSPPQKRNTSQLIPNLQIKYPEVFSEIQFVDVWIRPKKMNQTNLCKIIEEIYTTKFKRDAVNIGQPEDGQGRRNFSDFFFMFVNQISQTRLLAEQYSYDDLMFFLFTRAILEQSLQIEVFSSKMLLKETRFQPHFLKRFQKILVHFQQYTDISSFQLNYGQVHTIINNIFGEDDEDSKDQFLKIIKDKMEYNEKLADYSQQEQTINAYFLLYILLEHYQLSRESTLTTKIIHQTPNYESNTNINNHNSNSRIRGGSQSAQFLHPDRLDETRLHHYDIYAQERDQQDFKSKAQENYSLLVNDDRQARQRKVSGHFSQEQLSPNQLKEDHGVLQTKSGNNIYKHQQLGSNLSSATKQKNDSQHNNNRISPNTRTTQVRENQQESGQHISNINRGYQKTKENTSSASSNNYTNKSNKNRSRSPHESGQAPQPNLYQQDTEYFKNQNEPDRQSEDQNFQFTHTPLFHSETTRQSQGKQTLRDRNFDSQQLNEEEAEDNLFEFQYIKSQGANHEAQNVKTFSDQQRSKLKIPYQTSPQNFDHSSNSTQSKNTNQNNNGSDCENLQNERDKEPYNYQNETGANNLSFQSFGNDTNSPQFFAIDSFRKNPFNNQKAHDSGNGSSGNANYLRNTNLTADDSVEEQNAEEDNFNEDGGSYSKGQKIDLKNQIQVFIHKTAHLRLQEFIDLMLTQYNLEERQYRDASIFLKHFIGERVDDLLISVFSFDQIYWFDTCGIHHPTEKQLAYLENLQQHYRDFLKKPISEIDNHEINSICKRLLQTPELAKQIGKLLVKIIQKSTQDRQEREQEQQRPQYLKNSHDNQAENQEYY